MRNDVSAAVNDGGMPAFAECDLLLQFCNIIDAHGTHGDISAVQGLHDINCWPFFRIAHDIAEMPTTFGDQWLKGLYAAHRQYRFVFLRGIERFLQNAGGIEYREMAKIERPGQVCGALWPMFVFGRFDQKGK